MSTLRNDKKYMKNQIEMTCSHGKGTKNPIYPLYLCTQSREYINEHADICTLPIYISICIKQNPYNKTGRSTSGKKKKEIKKILKKNRNETKRNEGNGKCERKRRKIRQVKRNRSQLKLEWQWKCEWKWENGWDGGFGRRFGSRCAYVLFMSLLNMRSRRSQPKSSPLRHVYTISYGYSIGLCTQDTHTYPYGMRFYAYSILFECWQLQIQIHLQPKLQIEILTYTHVCVCVCVCGKKSSNYK